MTKTDKIITKIQPKLQRKLTQKMEMKATQPEVENPPSKLNPKMAKNDKKIINNGQK